MHVISKEYQILRHDFGLRYHLIGILALLAQNKTPLNGVCHSDKIYL